MVSSGEMRKINRMINYIREKGEIHKWDLIDEAKISIRDYYQLKGYMERKNEHLIEYNKTTGYYYYIGKSLVDTKPMFESDATD